MCACIFYICSWPLQLPLYRTTVCDSKSAGWCCNQFVRADVSRDMRVNYVRLVGENNLSVIMSFTSVNRVSSSVLSHWLAVLTRRHTHLTVIDKLQSNGQQANNSVLHDYGDFASFFSWFIHFWIATLLLKKSALKNILWNLHMIQSVWYTLTCMLYCMYTCYSLYANKESIFSSSALRCKYDHDFMGNLLFPNVTVLRKRRLICPQGWLSVLLSNQSWHVT